MKKMQVMTLGKATKQDYETAYAIIKQLCSDEMKRAHSDTLEKLKVIPLHIVGAAFINAMEN